MRIKNSLILNIFGILVTVANAAPMFSYVPTLNQNLDSDTISILNFNPSTGVLSSSNLPQTTFTNQINISSVVTDPTSKYLYALSDFNGIYSYLIDPNTGTLTKLGTVAVGSQYPEKIIFNGSYAYIPSQGSRNNSGDIEVYSYNSATGSLRMLQKINNKIGNPSGMVIDSSGKYAYVTTTGTSGNGLIIYSINSNGLLSQVGSTPLGNMAPSGIIADKNEHVYMLLGNTMTGGGTIVSYSVDQTTGALTQLASIPAIGGNNSYPDQITFSPDNQYAFIPYLNGTGAYPQNCSFLGEYSVNQINGTFTPVGSYDASCHQNTSNQVLAPVFDPSGQYIYLSVPGLEQIDMFSYDAANGQIAPLNPTYGGSSVAAPVGSPTFN